MLKGAKRPWRATAIGAPHRRCSVGHLPRCPVSHSHKSPVAASRRSSLARAALASAALCTLLAGTAWTAITMTTTGGWTQTIDATDLVGGAGTDLTDTYESASDAVQIDINGTGEAWHTDIRKVDSNWHGDFVLYVRRTSDGTGDNPISGGTAYQAVTDVDTEFFTGNDERTGICVQVKLSGVSIQVPPDTYLTTLYYTVTEVQ